MLFVWGKWLPYHFARVQACAECFEAAGYSVVGIQYSDVSIDYRIQASVEALNFELLSPRLGKHETDFRPLRILIRLPRLLWEYQARVVFVPSYWDWSVTIAVISRMFGCRVVMMNESHAGTEQATGWKRWIKRQIVKRFDAALVGGEPHKRHFVSLGIAADKIFTGYDAVDGEFFEQRTDEIRAAQKRSQKSYLKAQSECSVRLPATGAIPVQAVSVTDFRMIYGLPQRYVLSLGRMVEKKNLAVLVAAYARYVQGVAGDGRSEIEAGEAPMALVFVGSGVLEWGLREQSRGLGLTVIDRTNWRAGEYPETRDSLPATLVNKNCGAVFFYGFHQIEENPVFYALAEAFVLPSLKEEWGLVVNEAMAAGLPVIVSRTAGCVEDLLPERGQVVGAECPVAGEGSDNVLEERSNGFVFDPGSVDALSEALSRLAEQKTNSLKDQETGGLTEMGKRSREIVRKFSCENFAHQALSAAQEAAPRFRQ